MMFHSPSTSSERSSVPDTSFPFQSNDIEPSAVCRNDLDDAGPWSQFLGQEASTDELHAIIRDPSSFEAAGSAVTSSYGNSNITSESSDFFGLGMSEASGSAGDYRPYGFRDNQLSTAPAKKNSGKTKSTSTVRESIATPNKIGKPPAPKIHGCTMCAEMFTRLRDARRHEQTIHHRKMEKVCSSCGKRFPRQDTLDRHKRSKTACKGILTLQKLYHNSSSFRQSNVANGPSTSTR